MLLGALQLLLFLRRGGDSALLGMDLFSEKKNVSVGEVGGQHYFVFRFVAGRGTEVGWNFEQLERGHAQPESEQSQETGGVPSFGPGAAPAHLS